MIVLGSALVSKIFTSTSEVFISGFLLAWAAVFIFMAFSTYVEDEAGMGLREFPHTKLAIRLVLLGIGLLAAVIPILAFAGVFSWADLLKGD
jgi:hypothetical protein